MTERLGDGPIEDRYREMMNDVARSLDEVFNAGLRGGSRTTGFVLMVFPYGEAEGARCNYISNGADRQDVVTLMKEIIARFEGQPEMEGTA